MINQKREWWYQPEYNCLLQKTKPGWLAYSRFPSRASPRFKPKFQKTGAIFQVTRPIYQIVVPTSVHATTKTIILDGQLGSQLYPTPTTIIPTMNLPQFLHQCKPDMSWAWQNIRISPSLDSHVGASHKVAPPKSWERNRDRQCRSSWTDLCWKHKPLASAFQSSP